MSQNFTQKCTLQCKKLCDLHENLHKNLHKILHKKLHYNVKSCLICTNCGVFSVKVFRLDRIGIKLTQNFTQKYTQKNNNTV